MKGKNLQLAGIIIYGILAVISVSGLFSIFNFENNDSVYYVLIYIVLYQIGIVFLIMNYFKNNKDGLSGIIFATVMRVVFIVPMLFFTFNSMGDDSFFHLVLNIEIIAKLILGIYNIGITMYVLSQNKLKKYNINKE